MRSWVAPLFAGAVAVAGCGGQAESAGDCRDTGCEAPFECVESSRISSASSREYTCSTELSLGIPECAPMDPALTVPFQEITTATGVVPLHWLMGECIAVSYDPALEELADEIAAAVTALNAVECSGLCFADPQPAESLPSTVSMERRVHFALLAEPGDQILLSSANYERATGRIVSALVEVRADALDFGGPGTLLGGLALATGLAYAPAGVDSVVVAEPRGAVPLAPTAADEASLCALYGVEPWCE